VKKLFIAIMVLVILSLSLSLVSIDTNAQTPAPAGTSTVQNLPDIAYSQGGPAVVQAGVYIIDIQSIDLANSNYKLDFYLWFNFNSSQVNATDVGQFEFINGEPTITQIDASDGYLEYRVTGTFIKTFDFTNYPFESHTLYIILEHQNLDNLQLVYTIDPSSFIEATAGVAGWNMGSLTSQVLTHSYGDQSFSRPEWDMTLSRPLMSGLIKDVLPISIITGISLLAFAMAAEDYNNKMALGITTLLSATAFHLSLLSGIPPTGYLTLADRMMIGVYILFLFNIGSAVYLMTLARKGKKEQATAYNRKSQRLLPVVVIAVIIMIILI
jgi:hypothetical protein